MPNAQLHNSFAGFWFRGPEQLGYRH
jgi:hypothetical protein